MNYTFEFAAVFENFDDLLYGCLLTLWLSIAAMGLALVAAIAAVLAQRLWPRACRYPIQAFVELVRNTPFLIQIFFIYFGLPAIGIRFDPNIAVRRCARSTPR